MTNTQKPPRIEGMLCPLLKKDVSKVCHKCEFYKSLIVTKPEEPHKPYEHWDCTFNWSLILGRDVGAAINGMQQATEEFRNETAKQNNHNAAVLNQVIQQTGKLAQGLITMAEQQEHQNKVISNTHLHLIDNKDKAS